MKVLFRPESVSLGVQQLAARASSTSDPQTAADWVRANAWISVPVIALLGWVQTWVVAAVLVGSSYEFVASRRYAGLTKRTVLAASLADDETCEPRDVIGAASMDPGLSSQLESMCDADLKPAGSFTMIVWLVQLAANLWAVVQVFLVWAHEDASNPTTHPTQVLAALTVNRGVWAIAVLGVLVPGWRLPALYTTTAAAVVLEIVCLSRAIIIAGHVQQQPDDEDTSPPLVNWTIMCYIFVGLEAFVLIIGWIAAALKLKYLNTSLFLPGVLWLAFGPIVVAVTAIIMH